MMAINLAQAYKRSDKPDMYKNVLKRFDWSATGYEFKLAIAVLEEDYENACELLRTVIKIGDLTEQEVLDWPLFKEFRKQEVFLDVFKELFGKDYSK